MVPNFMAYQPRLPEPEAPATSAAARLLAEVPVFRAEKKSEAGQPILFLRIFNDFESTCLLVEQDAWKCCDVKILRRCKQEPCVVCREDIQVGQMCRRLPCLHLFHRECIDQWIAVKAGFLLELSIWVKRSRLSQYACRQFLLQSYCVTLYKGNMPFGQLEARRDAFTAAFPGSGRRASAQAAHCPVEHCFTSSINW